VPLALVIGALAVALTAIGITVFSWRVYARVGPAEIGIGGPSDQPPSGPIPWVPLALVGAGALLILARR
jgi:hypothetical protein